MKSLKNTLNSFDVQFWLYFLLCISPVLVLILGCNFVINESYETFPSSNISFYTTSDKISSPTFNVSGTELQISFDESDILLGDYVKEENINLINPYSVVDHRKYYLKKFITESNKTKHFIYIEGASLEDVKQEDSLLILNLSSVQGEEITLSIINDKNVEDYTLPINL